VKNREKYALKEKTHGSAVLWVWGLCGDSRRFFCEYGMGMGIGAASQCFWFVYEGHRVKVKVTPAKSPKFPIPAM